MGVIPTKNTPSNIELAELLRSIAASYQIKGAVANKFKIIAYERAADAIEHLSSEAKDIWDDGKLENVGGIGPSIAEHLGDIFKNGHSKHFEELTHDIPPATFELMKLPGVGPKTALQLVTALKITKDSPIEQLKVAGQNGLIAKVEGFKEGSQIEILKAIEEYTHKKEERLLLPYAMGIAEEIKTWMLRESSVKTIEALGSLRRHASTVGDIDFAVASDDPSKVIEHFCKYPNFVRVIEKGTESASILLPGSVHVDLIVVAPERFGSLLQHFTGSKHHNIALREFALKKGLSLSEHGIKLVGKEKEKVFGTEEEFYSRLGLPLIPPELREGVDEIQLAKSSELPKLIEFSDIKGDLQMHSSFDVETSHDVGASSMEEMAEKAIALGYSYIAFTEHNPSRARHTEKQIVEILKRKREKVDRLNDKLEGKLFVFNSLEIDIRPSGEIPVPPAGLATLDFALVSIHSSFRLPRNEMTDRVLKALGSSPKVKIFAHPTGRLLNKREGVELDWEKIFAFCKDNGKLLEIDADPARTDLPDMLIRDAVKLGIKLSMGTDAHHVDGMDNMPFGVWNARRGWAKKEDVIVTHGIDEVKKTLLS